MAIEDGEWIMRGLDWDDPSRTQSWEELIGLIDEVGFLPLFKNEVDSFSAEENTSDLYWWTGDEEQDPRRRGHRLRRPAVQRRYPVCGQLRPRGFARRQRSRYAAQPCSGGGPAPVG